MVKVSFLIFFIISFYKVIRMHRPSLQEGSGAEHDTDDGIPGMPPV